MRADLAVRRAQQIFSTKRLKDLRTEVLSGGLLAPSSDGDAEAMTLPQPGRRGRVSAPPPASRRGAGDDSPEAMALVGEIDASAKRTQETLLKHGARAIEKITTGKGGAVTPTEALGLEAIVLLKGRPALLIQEGKFLPPPSDWTVLESHRSEIEQTFSRVGRIEVQNHPEYQWLGTGFLVGPKAIMTNRHVAREFAQRGTAATWTFTAPITARVDFKEELGGTTSDEHAITRIIGVHETYDLALLEVEWKRGTKAPAPLPIAAKAPTTATKMKGLKVYVVGYPAWDGKRNDPEPMRQIFANIFDVKRLQPGEITGVRAFVQGHDCSTLGGNSGSAVFDLETQTVIGLHYGGQFQVGNTAIPLWKLTGDALLKRAQVNFN